MSDDISQGELALIPHKIDRIPVNQRAYDGYIDATSLCKASGKQLNDYLRLKTTKEFSSELNRSTGIPVDLLIQIINTGSNENRGTWVHPQVAINLAQWASPKFAVLVSKWVFDWMRGGGESSYIFPYHIRRYMINRHKIPPTHFSMLDQMTVKLLGALETKGYIVPQSLMPYISLGRMFSKWLRNNGYEPENFPTYEHVFDDGKRPPVQARLYPNELMTDFNLQLDTWIRDGKALKYFGDRDKNSVLPLKQVFAELPKLQKKKLTEFNKNLKKAIQHSPQD